MPSKLIHPNAAFLPRDIISTLTPILKEHSNLQRHQLRENKRVLKSDAAGDDDDIDGLVESDDDNLASVHNTSDPTTFQRKYLPLFIPYTALHEQFNARTGHGWTPLHLQTYGSLRLFLIQYADTFVFHTPTERVGLLSSLPTGVPFPQLNNDIRLGTSLHLHKQHFISSADEQQQLDSFNQYLDQITYVGHRIPTLHYLPSLTPNNQLVSQALETATIEPIIKARNQLGPPQPTSAVTKVTAPFLTRPTQALQSSQSQQTKHNELYLSRNALSGAGQSDQHDLDEKMKNRGCAPQATSSLRGPLFALFFVLILYVLFSVLILLELVEPDAIASRDSIIYRIITVNQSFVRDVLSDFGHSQ